MHRLLILLTVFVLNFKPVNSQVKTTNRLSGIIADSAKKAVPYATIQIFKQEQFKTPLQSTYADINGHFQLITDTGKFTLIISYTGFNQKRHDINVTGKETNLGTITLSSGATVLQEVIVTAKKPLIEQVDDKLVYNVESDPIAKSQFATDILRRVPMVTVDGEGNVKLNGQSDFKILLNGRETGIFTRNPKDALRSFPGAVITKIEIITSPSAKYDAEGVGGIINIITQKNLIGYNGSVTNFSSTLGDFGNSLNLSAKKGKWGLFLQADISESLKDLQSPFINTTIALVPSAFESRTLTGEKLLRKNSKSINLELTHDIDSLHILNLFGSIGNNSSDTRLLQSITTAISGLPNILGSFDQQTNNHSPFHEFGTDFIKKFPRQKGKELSFRFFAQLGSTDTHIASSQDNPGTDRFINNNNLAADKEYTIQTDFIQPLKKGKIETGIKSILRKASSNYTSLIKFSANDPFMPNPGNTDVFDYSQDVYMGYLSYNRPLKKGSFRSGMRVEHTEIQGNFISSLTSVDQSYTTFIPNLQLVQKINSRYTMTLAYSLRLQRPFIRLLNPFINNNDSLLISYGNPSLGPQQLHTVSVQNRINAGKFFISLSLNSSYTKDRVVQYPIFDKLTGVTALTSANAGKEWTASIGGFISLQIGSKGASVGLSPSLKYNTIRNTLVPTQQNKGISGQLFSNFYFPVAGRFAISGSGGGGKGSYELTGSQQWYAFYQVNLSNDFFNKKLFVSVNLNNLHSRFFENRYITVDNSFKSENRSKSPFRVIYLIVSYKFGKLKERVSKKRGVENDDLISK